MTDNEQQNGHENPDSLRMEAQFPIGPYGYVKFNSWAKRDGDLSMQVHAFMNLITEVMTIRAAELARAWQEVTVGAATQEAGIQSAGVPLPAGPQPAGTPPTSYGRAPMDRGEVNHPPKAGDNVPGDTFNFIATHYKLTAERLELWQDGAQYPAQYLSPQSKAWPSEAWLEHMAADGSLQSFGKPIRVLCLVADKKNTKGNYYVNVVKLEVAE